MKDVQLVFKRMAVDVAGVNYLDTVIEKLEEKSYKPILTKGKKAYLNSISNNLPEIFSKKWITKNCWKIDCQD